MTNEEKLQEVKYQLDTLLPEIKEYLLDVARQVLESSAKPDYFMEGGTWYLTKFTIDNFCYNRPLRPLNSEVHDDFNRLNLVIK